MYVFFWSAGWPRLVFFFLGFIPSTFKVWKRYDVACAYRIIGGFQATRLVIVRQCCPVMTYGKVEFHTFCQCLFMRVYIPGMQHRQQHW